MNPDVDIYLAEGCGRCPLGGTEDCKVHNWTRELRLLRKIVLDCGLREERKWGAPCYTYQSKNVLMLSALNSSACLSFFKGSLLSDEKKLLKKPGEHSQAARLFRFSNLEQIAEIKDYLKACIFEAIEVEKAGRKVVFKSKPEPIPKELRIALEEDPVLKTAFENLSPGRQRGYILHISKAKQSSTRISRIKKCTPMILNGIGLHDKYQSSRK